MYTDKLQANELNSLMDQEQVALILGVSTKTLESWRWKKIGPRFIKVGRLARYRLADLVAYIEGLLEQEVTKQE